ncbi:uncharacterized protein LOC110189742 [Drosophila serrata]|uniref:uncharacterized protein LOC110189742 n=1 Tax=Drosophila serrata TaxID=7274 RepID=UPI000A1D2999|nr:uncharacterized protein LOC110189742 [Drosophila serrata]
MRRIPLYIAADPSPEDSEYETMTSVMCPRNLIECELFLKILRKETDAVFKYFARNADSCLTISKECLKMKDTDVMKMTLQNLNEIICRGPTDSIAFVDAILARSVVYLKNYEHEIACNDLLYYESLPVALKTTEGIIFSEIYLCVCLYLLRKYQPARDKLAYVKKLIDKAALPENSEMASVLNLLKIYEDKINQESRNVELCKKTVRKFFEPFLGYKFCRKIPYASKACKYVPKSGDNDAAVLASSDIPKGEIVLVEDPALFQFSAPFLNCSLCETHQELLYTCEDCRYKTYCSKACFDSDAIVHKFECLGYRIGLLPMLEATMLFRLFLQAAEYIFPAIFDFTMDGGVINNPREAWNLILEHAEEEDEEYHIVGDFLATRLDYKRLTKEQYRDVVFTAFRLAVFIYNDTDLIDKYFNLMILEKIDMINVIAAVLLRLSAHLLLNSHRHELWYPRCGEFLNGARVELVTTFPPRMPSERITANAFTYYKINPFTDFVECYKNVKKTPENAGNSDASTTKGESPLVHFENKLYSICLKNRDVDCIEDILNAEILPMQLVDKILEDFSTPKRCQMLKNIAKYFHLYIHQYINNFTVNNRIYQLKSSLCATLKTFKRSCKTENVKVALLPNGQILGVTLDQVNAGVELVLCCDMINQHDQNLTSERAQFQDFKFPSTINNEINIFGEIPKKSSELLRYHKLLTHQINNKVSFLKSSPKDLKVQHDLMTLYGTYNSFLTLHFPETHEMCLLGVLKFSLFLATIGFLQHSSDIIFHVIELIELNDIYLKDIGLYRQVFCVIQKNVEQYIDIMIDSQELGSEYPEMLLLSCACLLKRLMRHTEKLLDDEEASRLYMEFSTYHIKWKTILNSYILMPPGLRKYLLESK